MKVLVAGASGALGRQLVPLLVAAGHEVVGTTRSAAKRSLVRGLGAGGGVWAFVHVKTRRRRRWPPSRGAGAGSTTSSTTIRRLSPSGCRQSRPRSAPDRRGGSRAWLGRLVAGEAATVMMTEVRGASNAKAKRELGWEPGHPSWREGLAA